MKTKSKNVKYTVFWPTVFLAPFCIFFFVFNFFPILYSFYMSFLDWNGYSTKTFIGLDNYVSIFTKDTTFWRSMWNTVRIGIVGFPVSIILGLLV